MSKLGLVIPQILQFVLHTVNFRQPLVSRQNRHLSIFSHHQFRSWLHRKVSELDFTHVVSHVKSTLAVSLLVVSKTQPFSVCFPYRIYIIFYGGLSVHNFPLIDWLRLGAGIPNIGCVFRHQNPTGATAARNSPSARESAHATPREQGIACPFVCALPASPPLFLPIRTLIESEPQFMPMLCAAFSCAVSALARTHLHQSVCLIHDTSDALIQQRRDRGIAGLYCSCCVS